MIQSIKKRNGLILFAATVLAFFNISHEPIWLDESYTAVMASHSLADIWRFTETDVHPPLYYLLLHGVIQILGTSEIGYRFLSALFAIGLIGLGVGPVTRMWNRRTGICYSLLAMCSPGVVHFAQEARMYSMMNFAVTGAVVYGYLAWKHNRLSDYVGFGVLLVVGMYTHYFALLALALFCTFLLSAALIFKSPSRIKLCVVMGIAGCAYLPWLPSLLTQIQRVSGGFWIPETNLFIMEYAAMIPFSFKFEDIAYPKYGLVSMGLSLMFIGYGLYKNRSNPSAKWAQLLLVGIVVATFGMGILLSKLIVPVLMPRYMLAVTGLFFLAVAVGVTSISSNKLQFGALGALLLLTIPANYTIYRHTFNGPFKSMSAHVDGPTAIPESHRAPIAHEDWQTLLPLRHRLADRQHYLLVTDDNPEELFDDFYPPVRPIAVNDLAGVLKKHSAVWVIDSDMGGLIENGSLSADSEYKNLLSPKRFELSYSFVKTNVHLLRRKSTVGR